MKHKAQTKPQPDAQRWAASWGSDLTAFCDTHLARMVNGVGLALALSPTEGGRVALLMTDPAVPALMWAHEFTSFDAVMAAMDADFAHIITGEWAGVSKQNAQRFAAILAEALPPEPDDMGAVS